MRLGSKEAFQNLKFRVQTNTSQFEQYKPKKFTTLKRLSEQETGVLAPKRKNYVQMFKDFSYNVIPAIEKQIEIDLLRHQFKDIQSELVQQNLIQAYIRRLTLIKQLEMDGMNIKEEPEDFETENLPDKKNIVISIPLKDIDYNEIGYFVQFKKSEFLKYFKHSSPGNFKQNFVGFSKNFAVQLTEEGVKLIDYIDNSKRNEQIFQYILNQEGELKDEDVFQALFGTLRGDLYRAIELYRNDSIIHRLFVNSPVFDSIISFIIKEISEDINLFKAIEDPNRRNEIFKNLISEIKEKVDVEQVNAQIPDLFHKTVKNLSLDKKSIDLGRYVKTPYFIPEGFQKYRFQGFVNCGNNVFLSGSQGTGKTGVIMQAIMWAIKSDWVTVVVPSGYDWTQLQSDYERHHETGLFLQPALAQQFLDQFATCNEHLLSKIPVNLDLWGKFNFSGVHDNDTTAVPNIYDPVRKYYFKEHEKFLDKDEHSMMADQTLEYSVRLRDHILPQPKTLKDITDAALANPKFCTSAIYEILEQLYKQDKYPVLVAVDGANWFYRPSIYPSFRYESDKGLKGFIPPYHFSLARAFMHLDGHKIRNGYKIMAAQIYPLHQHVFKPKMIHLPENYFIDLQGLPLDHYRIFCEYCSQNRVWAGDDYQQSMVDQFWMETQGNLGETTRCMHMNWRDLI